MDVVDLVLEGGGVKGIALVGAISVLEDAGLTFPRVAGSSAGAIVGGLVAAGMRAPQIRRAMEALDFTRLRDETALDEVPVVGKGLSLWRDHGLYAGDYFHGLIEKELADLGVQTFADLRFDDPEGGQPGGQDYKLVVMTSDVSRSRLMRLPWDYPMNGIDPDEQSVADAIRASMSIPFFFRPVVLQIPGADPSVLVDGGMLSNFPVDTFDRTDGRPPRWPTIGIKLFARQPANEVQHVVKGDMSLALAMFGTMSSWHDRMCLENPDVGKRTIFVDTLGVKATDFAIDRETQVRLFESGRSAAELFLSQK